MSIKKLYFSFIAIIATTFSLAQVYPVQVNSTVLPPYLSTVASYSTTINQKYLVNIFTADLTTVNRQARLKLYIEGNGIQAQSQSVVNGATPIYLNGGETLSLSNLDLAPYFQIENLQGITPTQYANVLPEGNYKFCIEVYDYLTNQRISQKSCTFYYFLYNQPPLLNLPQNHSVVFYQDPQNIIFTWTPRHINATNIEYLFELVELLDNQAPSNYAFMVGAPIYSTTVSNTILHYGPAETQLIAGRKYAWRVKAQSQPGFGETAVFNNNGYSEIFDFVYPGNCEAPKFVLASSLNATQAKIAWEPDPKHLDYKVEYRKQGTDTWFTTAYYNNEAKIYDLEPGATYEFRVGGECLGNSITYSNVNTFTQPTTNTSALNCGIQPNIDLSNQSLFTGQLPNDQVIMAGDFSIKLTEVTGTGSYTGKGYTTVPYLSFVKIGVEFTDIKINTDFKLVQGEIKASYDPEWNNIIDVASIYDQIENIFDVFSPDTDEHSYQVDFVIPNASSIQVNGNSVVITGPNGETHTFDLDPGEMIIIRDQNGNVYGVPPGSDHAVALDPTKEDAAGFIPGKDNTEGLSSNGSVTAFSNVGARVSFQRATNNPDNKNSQFADDVKPANAHSNIAKLYKSIADGNGNYDFYHKGIQNDGKASRSTDFVEAIIDITDASIKADSIQFNIKGSKAKKVATKTVGNKTHFVLEVPVFETAQTFELLALLKPNSSGDKNKVIGAAKIIPIKIQQEVNVTVVPVNGADIPTNIESQLNAIYDDAAVKFKITIAPNYEVAKTTIECDKDYLLEKLSADQSSFIDTYKQGKDIKKDQYYVFITKNITPSKSISGFMPRHSQFGFVFTNQSGAEAKATSDLATIVAHELGHGVFELKHPWSEFTTGDRNSNTPWLMDYTAGTKLPYVHWQRISHPKFGLYVFDGSGQGEQASVGNMEQLAKFANPDKTFTFISISGKPITLPANTSSVTFSTGDDLNLAECADNFEIIPLGTLRSFVIGDKEYKICGSCNSSNFLGYYVANGNGCSVQYIDSYTKSNFKNSILGIPCIKNGSVIFKVIQLKNYFSNFNFNEVNNNYTSSGTKISYDHIANSLYNFQVANVDVVYVPFKFDPVYEDDVIEIISKNTSCNCESTNYQEKVNAFIYATQLQKNKATLGCFKTGIPIYFYNENITTNDSFNHTYVSNWSNTNINGFKRLKSDLNKFQNISTVNDSEIYDFLKKYVPESINSSEYDSLLSYVIPAGTPVSHQDVQNQHDDLECLWESISLSNRKLLIEKIANNNSSFDRTEEILINLIIHEKQNANELINYFKQNNYEIFWKIWDVLDNKERNLFVYFLYKNIMTDDKKALANTNYQNFYNNCVNVLPQCENFNSYDVLPLWRANALDVANLQFNLGAGGGTYELDFMLETEKTNDNSISIEAKTNFINYGDLATYWKYFTSPNLIYNKNLKPFDVITLVARMDLNVNGQVVLRKGDIVSVPAIFLHWIDTSIDSEQNAVVVRLLGDVIVVAAVAYSGGTLTPLLALDATIAGTDIVITVVNESSDKVDPRFKQTWDAIYALYNLANLPRAITSTYNSASKLFTFVKQSQTSSKFYKLVVNEEFINDFIAEYKVLNSNDKSNVLFAIDQLYSQIKNLSLIDLVVKRRLVKAIIELKFKLPYYNNTNSSLLFVESTTNANTFYLNIKASSNSNTFSSLASLEYVLSNGALVPKLTNNIRWLPSTINSTTSILQLNNILYVKNNATLIGNIEIVKNNNTVGDFYVKLLTNNFEAKISSFPNVLNKYNNLSVELKTKFEYDFGNAPATTLQKLNANNGELVDYWKRTENALIGLDSSVKVSARKSIEYLELFRLTDTSNRNGNGSLTKHLFEGDLVIQNNRVRGVSGIHHKNAITETGNIILSSTKIDGSGNPIFNLPVPSSTAINPIAIEAGSIVPSSNNNGVYSAKVWIWGDELENGTVATKGWRKKQGNGGEATFFPNLWDKEKTIMEIAFARWKLTVNSFDNGNNWWLGESSDGKVPIAMYINGSISNAIPTITLDYGSAFPIK